MPGSTSSRPRAIRRRPRRCWPRPACPTVSQTSITMASSFPAMVAMAPIIQANLAAIGIKAEIKTMEIPRYWDEVWGPSNFDMTTMYWVSPLADPDDFVYQQLCLRHWHQRAEELQRGDGRGACRRRSRATTLEARKEAYAEQQELSLEEMPIVPLVNAWLLIAHTDKLQELQADAHRFLKTLKDAWLEA